MNIVTNSSLRSSILFKWILSDSTVILEFKEDELISSTLFLSSLMTIFPKSATPVISVGIVMLSSITSFTKYHVEYPTPNNYKIAKKGTTKPNNNDFMYLSYKNSLKLKDY